MEISPIASPVAPGGYLRSPAVRVTVQNGEWGIHGISWQEPQCGCAEEFPICLPHTKSDPRSPRKGASEPKGIEASYECNPPFDPEELAASDPKKYLPEVAKLNFKGVTGPIAFDNKGDLRSAAVTFYQVKASKWVPLETVLAK